MLLRLHGTTVCLRTAVLSRPLLAGLLVWACVAAPAAHADEVPPNVVVIHVDDLGWMDVGYQGSALYETPNIDRMAEQGMRFTDGYAAASICSPTRAALTTGRYPARVGITDWIRARFQGGEIPEDRAHPTEYVGGADLPLLCPPNPLWMDLEEVTIADLLGPAGYTSIHIGKWHLGADDWYPEAQGFDLNLGGCDYGQPPSYFDPYTNPRLPEGIPTLEPRLEGEYLTDREADEAVRFIRDHRDERFFVHLAPYAVHTPIQARPELVTRYERKGSTFPADAEYAAMVESVDQMVGRILHTLDALDLADRTLVIFTSDNGGLDRGRGTPTSNAPLRSGKGFPYEGGLRVPLVIRWPGVVEAGTVSREPVSSIDYLPTIAEAAGVDLPEDRAIDGRSLMGHLRSGGAEPLEREALFWHFPHYRQGRTVTPYSIVRAGDWKLIKWWEGPTFELYHLGRDLGESQNLAERRPEEVQRLRDLLRDHLEEVGARLPRPNPAYRGG